MQPGSTFWTIYFFFYQFTPKPGGRIVGERLSLYCHERNLDPPSPLFPTSLNLNSIETNRNKIHTLGRNFVRDSSSFVDVVQEWVRSMKPSSSPDNSGMLTSLLPRMLNQTRFAHLLSHRVFPEMKFAFEIFAVMDTASIFLKNIPSFRTRVKYITSDGGDGSTSRYTCPALTLANKNFTRA